jgi:hypothetical protein
MSASPKPLASAAPSATEPIPAKPSIWKRFGPIAALLGFIGAVCGAALGYAIVTDARAVLAHWQRVDATVLRRETRMSSGGRHSAPHEYVVVTYGYELNGEHLEATSSAGGPLRVGETAQFYASPTHPRVLKLAESVEDSARPEPIRIALFGALSGLVNLPLLGGVIYLFVQSIRAYHRERRPLDTL